MAYTPINWQTGDTITADKLNRCDNGWAVTNSSTTICDETVITEDDGGMFAGQLTVSSITAVSITVTYDGTPYQCAQDGDGGYGTDVNFTFADYPFRIESDGFIVTETVGSHTVKVEAVESGVDTSAAFDAAVTAASPLYRIAIGSTTWQEAHDAMAAGRLAFYVAVVDGDTVEQFVALSANYNDDNQRYEIASVGTPADGLAVEDVIHATESNGALLRD